MIEEEKKVIEGRQGNVGRGEGDGWMEESRMEKWSRGKGDEGDGGWCGGSDEGERQGKVKREECGEGAGMVKGGQVMEGGGGRD